MSKPRRRGVSWEQTAAEDRPCVRCLATKTAASFPSSGRGGKGRWQGVTRVCFACLEAEAWAMHAAGYKPRIRKDWTTPSGGQMRMCTSCKQGKPRTRRFFSPLYEGKGLARTCRKCRTRISSRARARQREREGEAMRARQAKRARERRKLTKVKESERAARKRWRAKVKATPEGRAKLLETERMSRRLKSEREGKGPGRQQKEPVGRAASVTTVPSAPLVAFIERLWEQRREIARVLDDPRLGSLGALCEDLGITERGFRRWQSGEYANARIGTVERVLLNAEVEWFEVYSYDDHAATFLAVEAPA